MCREEARLRDLAEQEVLNAKAAQAEAVRLLQLERDLRALLDTELTQLRGSVPKVYEETVYL